MTTDVNEKEFDIIFAGGGTAACVTAARLAKADPDLSILIIEGGKNNKDDPLVTNPAIFPAHLAPTSTTALFYKSNQEKALNDREVVVPSGGILGGGSSINFMMYTRPQNVDYDSWNTEGWDSKSLLPYLKKLETFHVKHDTIDQELHGHDGPINISLGTHFQERQVEELMAGAEAIGYKRTWEIQDGKSTGFAPWAKFIGPDGKRQDTAHRYLHPLIDSGKYPNLHLVTENRISRVVFDEKKRAKAVEYEPSRAFQPAIGLGSNPTFKAYARKLVVLAAGALSTPSILERSGIGSPKHLEPLGIEVVSNLPDVGEHYQDHQVMLYSYKTTLKPEETNDGLLSGRVDFAKAAAEGDKMLGWNMIDVCSKIRPTEDDVAALGQEFKELWDRDFKSSPSRPIMLCGMASGFLGDHKLLNEDGDGIAQYVTMGNYTAYPYSRGSIHIVSKDGQTPASFNTGFLSHPADIKKHLWAYKVQREAFRRTNSYNGELALLHPKFPDGSKAALQDGPSVQGGFNSADDRKNLPQIEYSDEDDKAIEQFIRDNVSTTWHSCGTCRMANQERGGVVDKNLNVYGVTGLKCADLSIVPDNIGANTGVTAIVIGEKAADIIGCEIGVQV